MRTYNTLQEVFDGIWDHFITKGKPVGRRPDGICIFADTGCAVGCLIDNKELCAKMDGSFSGIAGYFHHPHNELSAPLADIFIGIKTLAYKVEDLAMLQAFHDISCISGNNQMSDNYPEFSTCQREEIDFTVENCAAQFPKVFKKRLEIFARKHELKVPT